MAHRTQLRRLRAMARSRAIDSEVLYAVIGRAVIDPKFRKQLLDSAHPENQKRALRSAGIGAPSQKLLNDLNAAKKPLEALAERFGIDPAAA
jgi:hypothetical protein